MSKIYTDVDYERCCFSRANKRSQGAQDRELAKRIKMETSTPTLAGGYRSVQLIPEGDSTLGSLGTPETSEVGGGATSDMSCGTKQRSPTQVSNNMDGTKITPDKVLSESDMEQKLAGGAGELSGALRRSNSLPNLTWETIENSMFNPI